MQRSIKGLSRLEMLTILIIFLVIIFFIVPKFFNNYSKDEKLITAKNVASTIYSAYKLCMVEEAGIKGKCTKANDIINNINYEELDQDKGYFRLLNQAEINFTNNDPINDGTSFAITLPDKMGTFPIFIDKNGNFTSKNPGKNKCSGGPDIKRTIDPFKN